jgi:hypothetical protein
MNDTKEDFPFACTRTEIRIQRLALMTVNAFFRGLAIVLCLNCASVQGKKDLEFCAVQLPTDKLSPETLVHPVNLFGDQRKELVAVNRESVEVFSWVDRDIQSKQLLSLPVPKNANGKTYYGFARLGFGEQRNLVILMPDGIYYYPNEADHIVDSPQLLLKKPMIQGEGSGNPVQYFDFALDLDGNGQDDLLVPEENGFSIYRQSAPLKFEQVALPRNPFKRENTFSFRRQLPDDPVRVPAVSAWINYRKGVNDLVIFDANNDGLQDLVFTRITPGPKSRDVERYEIFLQRKNMKFDSSPYQTIEVPYDERAYVTFRDFNEDGRADAMVVNSNLDIVNPRTIVRFYISGTQQYQLFTRETERFVTKDPIGLVRVADFNRDGIPDFAMTFFSYQFGSTEDIVDLVVANKVRFKLQFFLGRGKRGFTRQPDFEQELSLNMKAEGFSGYQPIMLVDDMNGDSVMDLAVRIDEGRLVIYGSTGKPGFARQPSAEITFPNDASLDFEDVNGDGLADVLVSTTVKRSLTIYLSSPK